VSAIRALVVTHGEIGRGLVDVVRHLLGTQEGVVARSNDGLSGGELHDLIERELVEAGEDTVFLFTDLAGGSCDIACRAVAAGRSRGVVVSGVNLPMLLEFCHYRHRLEPGPLVARVLRKGRLGIGSAGGDAS
jgi:mannose/fructose-specific phosphotransferase system component IIA